jgi:NADPH:quinone reductase-like Zn-dependent oxidoreductase
VEDSDGEKGVNGMKALCFMEHGGLEVLRYTDVPDLKPGEGEVLVRIRRIVIVGNTSGPLKEIDIRYIFVKQISMIGSTMGSHQDFLDITAFLWAGKLKPVIHTVLPLSQGREAFELLEKGEQFGKIVLVP